MQRLTAVLLAGLFGALPLVAQSPGPTWLQIERADKFAAEGQYGLSIQLYREALASDPDNADALFGLARAFKAVGDLTVAEQYFLNALDAGGFPVASRTYALLYELADLYRVQRRFSAYESTLVDIVEMAEAQASARRTVPVSPDVLSAALATDGLDRLLVLYRVPEDGATRARGELCELLVGLGRNRPAADYGLYAAVQQITTLVDAVLARDPEFSYQSVEAALKAAEFYPEARAYMDGTNLYHDLYFLGSAVFAAGDPGVARGVWSTLVALPGAGQWASRSAIQLTDPRAEPLLIPPR